MKIKELLEREEFEATQYPGVKYDAFEALYDYNVIGLFDEMVTELGRIPSSQEFVSAGLKRAKEFFESKPTQYIYKWKSNHTFELDDHLKSAVMNRLSRTYNSYLVEEQVKEFIKDEYDVKMSANQRLDLNFGCDVCVMDEDRLYYIHIAKDSYYSRNHIKEKGRRKSYIFANGMKHYWTRNWGEAHHTLLYNDSNTEDLNGNVVFTDEYLKDYFDRLFEEGCYDELEDSELMVFWKWMKKRRITIK